MLFKLNRKSARRDVLLRSVILALGLGLAVPQFAWATFTYSVTYRNLTSGTSTTSTTCAAATSPGPTACNIAVTRYEYTSQNTPLWEATGLNGGGYNFSALSGADSGDFTLSGGTLTFASNPNFESPADADTNNIYVVAVQVDKTTGGTNYKTLITFTITISDVVDETAPVISGTYTGGNISESTNGDPYGLVYDFNATDSGTVTWSISGTDNLDFSINASGQLFFVANGLPYSYPDFDNPKCGAGNNSNSCSITITATDNATFPNSSSRNITLTVINNAPTVYGYYAYPLYEYLNDSSDYQVAQGLSYDRISSWSLSGADSDKFVLSTNYCAANYVYCLVDVYPKPGVIFNFEKPNDANEDGVFELELTATDFQGLSSSTNLYVSVEDWFDETAPKITGPSNLMVYEGYESENSIARYAVVNEPYGFSVDLVGDDASFFCIDEDLVLRFCSNVAFEDYADFNGDNVFEFSIRVNDDTNPYTDQNTIEYPVSVTLLPISSGEAEGMTPQEIAEQTVIDSSAVSRMLSVLFAGLSASTESAVATSGLTGVKSELLTYLGLPGVNASNVDAVLAAYAKHDATATLAEFKDFAVKYSVVTRLSDSVLAKGVTITDLVNSGLLPAGTTANGLLILKLRETPLEQRDTVAELQALVVALK